MVKQRKKPSGLYYGLALLVFIAGCGTALIVLLTGSWSIPTMLTELDDIFDELTRVVVPGSAEITFSDTGAHAVYYEYRSVVDGVHFNSSRFAPDLDCRLTFNGTGDTVAVVNDTVLTNRYSNGNSFAGFLIKSITIDQPGRYTFSCQYPDGSPEPEVVLAVSHNFVWEIFSLLGKPLATIFGSLGILCSSSLLAIIIAIVVAVKRSGSKHQIEQIEA